MKEYNYKYMYIYEYIIMQYNSYLDTFEKVRKSKEQYQSCFYNSNCIYSLKIYNNRKGVNLFYHC